jgi:integrase
LQDYEFKPNEEALERVRDVFLFCCFTGLRYSDVAKLKRSDVKKGFIKVVTQKTVDGLIIELNKYSQAILDKYKEIKFPKDKALPVISNEKSDEHLKRLGQVAN